MIFLYLPGFLKEVGLTSSPEGPEPTHRALRCLRLSQYLPAFFALVSALAGAAGVHGRWIRIERTNDEQVPVFVSSGSFWRAFICGNIASSKRAGQHQREYWPGAGVSLWVLQLFTVSMRSIRLLRAGVVPVRHLYWSWAVVRWADRLPWTLRSPV